MKLGNRVGLRENDFEAVGKAQLGPFRPGHRAFRRKRGNTDCHFHGTGGHYAASLALALTGVRKSMARFSFRRYFLAPASTSSPFPPTHPPTLAFPTSCC